MDEEDETYCRDVLRKNKQYRKQRIRTARTFVGHRLGTNFSDINIECLERINFKTIEALIKNSKEYQAMYKKIWEAMDKNERLDNILGSDVETAKSKEEMNEKTKELIMKYENRILSLESQNQKEIKKMNSQIDQLRREKEDLEKRLEEEKSQKRKFDASSNSPDEMNSPTKKRRVE